MLMIRMLSLSFVHTFTTIFPVTFNDCWILLVKTQFVKNIVVSSWMWHVFFFLGNYEATRIDIQ